MMMMMMMMKKYKNFDVVSHGNEILLFLKTSKSRLAA